MTLVATAKWHVPELDGLRAISVGFVLLLHASYGRLTGGFLGVDIFFVLSGYLITKSLLGELRATSDVSLRYFYLRRVFRIMPPLVACIALCMLLWGGAPNDRGRVALAAFAFYANFLPAKMLGMLGHTWSLAIEEQFYLVWPAAFLLATRGGVARVSVLASVAMTVIVASLIIRLALIASEFDQGRLYTFTPARLDGLMVGSLLAICEDRFTRAINRRFLAPLAYTATTVALICLLLATREFMQHNAFGFLGFAALAATLVFTIPRLAPRAPLRCLFTCAPMRYFGKRSYGLYLYHYPIFTAAEALRVQGSVANYLGVLVVKLAASVAITEASWRLLERPMLRLKDHFSRTASPPLFTADILEPR